MKIFFNKIHECLSHESQINWFIVHDIAQLANALQEVSFSFVDRQKREGEPFGYNQGFISIETNGFVGETEMFIKQEVDLLADNLPALANLYILISRISYKEEDKKTLINAYKKRLGTDGCKQVYHVLVESANREAFRSLQISQKQPQTTDEWLQLFVQSQYLHRNADLAMCLLDLVETYSDRTVSYKSIAPLAPFLRAGIVACWGLDVEISSEEIDSLSTSVQEISFLAALLLDDYQPGKQPSEWISAKLITLFLQEYWSAVGRIVLISVYGIHPRNKQPSGVYHKLEELCGSYIAGLLREETDASKNWINGLSFPEDFIALFGCVYKMRSMQIPDSLKMCLFNKFLSEMQRIHEQAETYFQDGHKNNLFMSYNLQEDKYQLALAYLLLCSFCSDKESQKQFKKLCYQYKTFYYGGFYAQNLGIIFTEIMMLIFLHISDICNVSAENLLSVEKYLEILAETLLVPYIHLSEREEEIWNSRMEEQQQVRFRAGLYLINSKLAKISNSDVRPHYRAIFEKFEQVKTTQWPFEKPE